MRIAIYRLIGFVLAFSFSAVVWSHDLTGLWDLKIEDKSHHVVTALVIEFSKQEARSCIGGNWFRVDVVSSTTEDRSFYPASSSLSYGIENGQLIIGRNEVCDTYFWLKGSLDNESIRGEYFRFGWGRESLGFFMLKRKK